MRVAGPSWPMSPERADAEARAYEQVAKVAPDKIPAILGYDPENYALVMEDMSDLEVLRTVLNEGAAYGPDTSAAIGEFVAQLVLRDQRLRHAVRRPQGAARGLGQPRAVQDHRGRGPVRAVHRARAQPLAPAAWTTWPPPSAPTPRLRTEVADLRHIFMTSAQALLHGDLHTGSVMVGEREGAPVVRVFDPEFSFVGPIGFDLGLYWANALVSEERARALGTLTDHGDQLRLSWEAFETEFRRLWPTRVDTFFDDAYLDRFLRRVWTEALGFAGTEIVRRIIGFAHLTDLTTLPDPVPASRRALLLGRELIVRRAELRDPDDVRAVVDGAVLKRRRGRRTAAASPRAARSAEPPNARGRPRTTGSRPCQERR